MGDVTASLYLEKYGYTYKVRAYIRGYKTKQVVRRSYVWLADRKNAEARMLSDLEDFTQQQSLF